MKKKCKTEERNEKFEKKRKKVQKNARELKK